MTHKGNQKKIIVTRKQLTCLKWHILTRISWVEQVKENTNNLPESEASLHGLLPCTCLLPGLIPVYST